MSDKKPSRLSTKPNKNTQPVNADSWVQNHKDREELLEQTEVKEKTKRITFEVPEKQHQATKILAAQKGLTIKELMQSLLVTELNKNQ